MDEKEKTPKEAGELKKEKKEKDEEKLPYCTTAPSGEQHRANEGDEPCDDGRSGDVD